ncbi:MAG: anion permease [Immundisolibacteraceae bacterium]|nr:anion permease [Immundisolibacteraceae bacterium]
MTKQAVAPVDRGGSYSWVKRTGFIAGPLGAALIILSDLWWGGEGESMPVAALHTLGLAWWMACWWLTEALPIAATALLPIVLIPLLGISPIKVATAPYAHPLVMLFMGGFIIGIACNVINCIGELHCKLFIEPVIAM